MGWGLNSKDAGRAAASWLVHCETCTNAQPIDGTKPKRNRCAVKVGEYYSYEQRFCDDHSTTRWRKKIIEKLKDNKKGG